MARLSVVLTVIILGLCLFGLVMVGNASVVDALKDFGDKWYYLKLQVGWFGLGLGAFLMGMVWPHQKWQIVSRSLLVVSIVCLVAVLIPGIGSQALGARRWISMGPIGFQPAELAKLAMVVYLAGMIGVKTKISHFLGIVGVVCGLIMLEPDLGTTIVIIAISFLMYFGGGAKLKPLLAILPIGLLVGVLLIVLSPYRFARLKTFFDHSGDPLGSSYHIRQVLISLGSGGVFGVGLGQSRQKYEFLPEVTTDSIFAVVGEELGLVGGTSLLLAFMTLIWLGFKVSSEQKDDYSRNLGLGITAWLGSQALINLAAMVALVPLTGIPLPFISYGGSALVTNMLAGGILVNLARQKK